MIYVIHVLKQTLKYFFFLWIQNPLYTIIIPQRIDSNSKEISAQILSMNEAALGVKTTKNGSKIQWIAQLIDKIPIIFFEFKIFFFKAFLETDLISLVLCS